MMGLPELLFDEVYVSQGTLDQIQEDIQRLAQLISSSRIDRNESLIGTISEHPKCQLQSDWLDDQLLLDAQQRDLVDPYTAQDLLLAKMAEALYVVDDPRLFATVGQVLPDNALTMRDMVKQLWQSGKIRKSIYDDAIDYLDKTRQIQMYGFGDLDFSCGIVLSYGALVSLAHVGLLDSVIDSFSAVHFSIPTFMMLRRGASELKFYQATLEAIKRIELGITERQSFIVRPTTQSVDADSVTDRESSLEVGFLETLILAEELQLPLWTDDLASRKLLASMDPETTTFDTRIALDVAFDTQHIAQDALGDSVLQLLRWNYQFVHVNSDLIYWTIEQHNFQENEDADVLLNSLDASVASAYERTKAALRTEVEDSPVLERQFALFTSNVNVYAQLLLRVWNRVPCQRRYIRSKWTSIILNRISRVVPAHAAGLDFLILICLLELLRNLDNERLDHFLVLCTSGFTLPRREDVDTRILLALVTLYKQGDYHDKELDAAARLLNVLRSEQYGRVIKRFKRKVPADFVKAVMDYRSVLRDRRHCLTGRDAATSQGEAVRLEGKG
jgi:hypothetical protein